jgi:hypothetical protein
VLDSSRSSWTRFWRSRGLRARRSNTGRQEGVAAAHEGQQSLQLGAARAARAGDLLGGKTVRPAARRGTTWMECCLGEPEERGRRGCTGWRMQLWERSPSPSPCGYWDGRPVRWSGAGRYGWPLVASYWPVRPDPVGAVGRLTLRPRRLMQGLFGTHTDRQPRTHYAQNALTSVRSANTHGPSLSSAIETLRLSSPGCYTTGAAGCGCWGISRMKARRLIKDSSFAPDQLKALGQAFDDAWERIAPSVSNSPEAIEAARFALADIVLGLAKNGSLDPRWLADAAVQVMLSRSSGPGW